MEPHWVATAERRAATVERTLVEVVLKYSLNLVEDPDEAAVEAARAREAHLLKAKVVAALLEVEQPDCRTVRSVTVITGMALASRAAAAPSTRIARSLDLNVTADPDSSVEVPTA
jgi:hypothetical protein